MFINMKFSSSKSETNKKSEKKNGSIDIVSVYQDNDKTYKTSNGANIFKYIGTENGHEKNGTEQYHTLKTKTDTNGVETNAKTKTKTKTNTNTNGVKNSLKCFFRKETGRRNTTNNVRYINDVYNTSGSYQLDMGSIDQMNPSYQMNPSFKMN